MKVLFMHRGWVLAMLIFLSAASRKNHPFHVGVIEIEHNATDRSLELSCKLFTDDFENALRTRFHVPIDLGDPAKQKGMDSLVARYIQDELILSVNGKRLSGRYLGFEQDKEAIYAYIEYPGQGKPTQLAAECGLMYDQFTDQINIFHVTVEGKRQSSKLNYPSRNIEFRF
ncbi:MAG: hypothetical protein FJX92_08195 [Bacteroidetes bacterium]|nr:hypothetical protein [Bacteroidota bacterium]